MKISVVIPVYNVKSYLERCINSVISQTYKDLEIILVDDGSTDGSGELCDLLAATDSRILVIHNKNQGVSVARNTGIRRATGDYIFFIDSDDIWLLQEGVEIISKNCEPSIDLIIFKSVDIWNNEQKTYTNDYDIEKTNSLPDAQAVFTHLILTQQFRSGVWLLMVRRTLLTDNEIFFPAGIISEDIFWDMQLWQHVQKVKMLNLNFYGYCHREASITTTVSIHYFHSYDYIFSYWKAQCDSGCKNAETIRVYMANMWVNRGYAYHNLADIDKPEALQILQKHIDLLKYGRSPKAMRVRKLVQFMGVKSTAIVLGWYWQLRSLVKH